MFLAFALLVGSLGIAIDLGIGEFGSFSLVLNLAARLAGLAISTGSIAVTHDLAALFEGATGDWTHARLYICIELFRRSPIRRADLSCRTGFTKALGLGLHGRAGRFRHVGHACS